MCEHTVRQNLNFFLSSFLKLFHDDVEDVIYIEDHWLLSNEPVRNTEERFPFCPL